MQRSTDDPTGSVSRSKGSLRGMDWTLIGLGLILAVLLLVGGLIPTRERSRRMLNKNLHLAEEILKTRKEIEDRRKHLQDLKFDPLTQERLLREKGALAEGEIRIVSEEPGDPGRQNP